MEKRASEEGAGSRASLQAEGRAGTRAWGAGSLDTCQVQDHPVRMCKKSGKGGVGPNLQNLQAMTERCRAIKRFQEGDWHILLLCFEKIILAATGKYRQGYR